jgi:hypothetical protein
MKVILSLIFFLSLQVSSEASLTKNDTREEVLDFLVSSNVKSFNDGIAEYNKITDLKLPKIKRIKAQLYQFVVKKNEVRFSLTSYLNDEFFINGKKTSISKFGIKEVSYNFFISDAVADEPTLDGETTRIILDSLGQLTKKLEEAGLTCFMGCVGKVKESNMKKILNTLTTQLADCQNQRAQQNEKLEKFPSYQMVNLLHSTFDPQFQGTMKLFETISRSNQKKVKEFMKNYLMIEKKHGTCIEVMVSGTLADGQLSNGEKGFVAATSGRVAGEAIMSILEEAKANCLKMEALKQCLIDVKENLGKINNIRRDQSRKHNMNFPEEKLPSIQAIER